MNDDVGDDGKRKGRLTLVTGDRPKMGRPTKYTQELGDEICGMLMQAISIKAICELEHMPETRTVSRWLRQFPDFRLAYAQAREDSADAYADEIMAIADDRSEDWKQDPESGIFKPDYDVINRAKLRVDARKWIAAKLKPASYGERVEAKISGTVDHRHAHAHIDATALAPEAREALRSAILGQLAKPVEPEED